MRIFSVNSLKPGMRLGKTIVADQGQVLLRQGVVLTERHINYLQRYRLQVVYVSTSRDVVVEDVISDHIRLKAVAETRDILAKVRTGGPLELENVSAVLLAMVDELLLQDDIMVNLVELRSFDEDLFSHSVNVAILSLLIGIDYNYKPEKLRALALAALLHDIGQIFAAGETDKSHVELGVDFLRRNGINRSVLQSVLQHHERWDGTGYPNQLQGEEISEPARIIRVTDTFDRLSANNRYPLEKVVRYLMEGSGKEFEPRSVKTFVNSVFFYPVGTEVELNTAKRG